MPALQPPPRHPPANLAAGKIDCPRCGSRFLDPQTLRCLCSAEFTPEGLAHMRALPRSQALRT